MFRREEVKPATSPAAFEAPALPKTYSQKDLNEYLEKCDNILIWVADHNKDKREDTRSLRRELNIIYEQCENNPKSGIERMLAKMQEPKNAKLLQPYVAGQRREQEQRAILGMIQTQITELENNRAKTEYQTKRLAVLEATYSYVMGNITMDTFNDRMRENKGFGKQRFKNDDYKEESIIAKACEFKGVVLKNGQVELKPKPKQKAPPKTPEERLIDEIKNEIKKLQTAVGKSKDPPVYQYDRIAVLMDTQRYLEAKPKSEEERLKNQEMLKTSMEINSHFSELTRGEKFFGGSKTDHLITLACEHKGEMKYSKVTDINGKQTGMVKGLEMKEVEKFESTSQLKNR